MTYLDDESKEELRRQGAALASLVAKKAGQHGTVTATVSRIDDDGTVWVSVGGQEAPAQEGMKAHLGDKVTVRLVDGQAVVTDNVTRPATDDAAAVAAQGMAVDAQNVAEMAMEVSGAIGQHFWDDESGAHISTEEKNPAGERNAIFNTLGILFRERLVNLMGLLSGSAVGAQESDRGMAIFDGLGNAASNVVAWFGRKGYQLGKAGETRQEGDYHSLKLIDKEGNTYMHVSDLRNENGSVSLSMIFYAEENQRLYVCDFLESDVFTKAQVNGHDVQAAQIGQWVELETAPQVGDKVEIFYTSTSVQAKAYTFGIRKEGSTIGQMSFAEGSGVEASGRASHVEGADTVASGPCSHAEGIGTKATEYMSHAEGNSSEASAGASHAEGSRTIAGNLNAHAEGLLSKALGSASHAEGNSTKASGHYSHSQNIETIAEGESQTALGKYNVADTTSAVIVGNGTSDSNRSNAAKLDWNGNAEVAGKLTFGNGAAGTRQFLAAKTPGRNGHILWAGGGKLSDGNTNGTVVGLGAGALTLVGGGEYANNRYMLGDLNDGDERLYLGSDNGIYFESGANTIANRKTMEFTSSGVLRIHASGNQGYNITYPYKTDEPPESNTAVQVINTHNADSKREGAYIQSTWGANGSMVTQFGAQENKGGTQAYNALSLGFDANGNRTVNMTDKPAWRSALELGGLALDTANQGGAVNCNDLPSGIHYVTSSGTNIPTSFGGMCICAKYSINTAQMVVQMFVENTELAQVYTRRYINRWTDWKQVG